MQPSSNTLAARAVSRRVPMPAKSAIAAGASGLASLAFLSWLAICIYSWVGPGMFKRSLDREIGGVVYDEDF